jgi:hypothetical protein
MDVGLFMRHLPPLAHRTVPKKPFGIAAYPVPCGLNPDSDRPQAATSGVNRIVDSNDAGVQVNVVF